MRSPKRRLAAFARLVLTTMVALAIAAPASAQFGGLKKKAKAAADQEGAARAPGAATEAPAKGAAPGDLGGMVVLNEDVVGRLLAGLRAGQAEREAAAREDTPFGRYQQAKAAYAVARPRCEAAQKAFFQRAATNQKLLDRYNRFNDKTMEAQEKGDLKLAMAYQDSALATQDPSCIVKDPEQPQGYYEAQRDLDSRVEKLEAETSDFAPGELAMIKERTTAILEGQNPPGGASPMEKSAVSAKSAELKPLLGMVDQPASRADRSGPTPAPAPGPAPAAPQMSPAVSSSSACMMRNAQVHEAELEALAERAEAAEAAGDTGKLMAIADTMQRIQMKGCK